MKYISFFIFCLLFACTKDKVPTPPISLEKPWEKFVGHYKVYDTTGVYLFDSEIEHYSGKNIYGLYNDSLRIKNFMGLMDYEFQYMQGVDLSQINLLISDSVKDYQNNHWFINVLDDTSSLIEENRLIDDKIVFYFRITNIKFYINESVPYVNEKVKHVYIKQP